MGSGAAEQPDNQQLGELQGEAAAASGEDQRQPALQPAAASEAAAAHADGGGGGVGVTTEGKEQSVTAFLKKLNWSTTKQELSALFAGMGLKDVRLVNDRVTGKPKVGSSRECTLAESRVLPTFRGKHHKTLPDSTSVLSASQQQLVVTSALLLSVSSLMATQPS